MVCINIHHDIVSFHPRAVIDEPHYVPCKMMEVQHQASVPARYQLDTILYTVKILEIALQTTLPTNTQLYLVWEDE